jgi:hypothetical protein
MPRFLLRFAFPALVASLAASSAGQLVIPQRGEFDSSTGYLESRIGRDWYRGSGVVAKDPRLIYSCGHLFYEKGIWATDQIFYRDWNSSRAPAPSTGVRPRGFRYFTSYASRTDQNGQDSESAFSADFSVLYGFQPLGPAIATLADGRSAVASPRLKRIVGYPESLDATGARGYYYQYGTGWFPNAATYGQGNYREFDGVTTGGGNSGGPVFVQDEGGASYSLAGILVSGSYETAGIYALDASSDELAAAALGSPGVTRRFANRKPLRLPDGAARYSSRAVRVSGFAGNVTHLGFDLSVKTARRSDLDIYLVSPAGRIRWINKSRSREKRGGIAMRDADFSGKFRGAPANGVWKLKMRDAVPGSAAKFRKFSLTVTGAGE